MKNIESYSLKNCIFMTNDEYDRLLRTLTSGDIDVSYDFEGISYTSVNGNESYTHEYINNLLSKHFDVTVTSVHIDDCDYIGVWICYKENN